MIPGFSRFITSNGIALPPKTPARSYAGIGSRKTPVSILEEMRGLAISMASLGILLRSGGALGADTAFQEGCREVSGPMEIHLPWENYNGMRSGSRGPATFFVLEDPQAMGMASSHHPAWRMCSPGARKLHARNCHILLGPRLDDPVDFVVCWTSFGRNALGEPIETGGTAQGLRIARQWGIPIVNLGSAPD